MAARAGEARGEVLLPQEVWDSLTADPRLQEFKRRHQVELKAERQRPRRGPPLVSLTVRPLAQWHWEAQVRDELIRLCNGRGLGGVRAATQAPPNSLGPSPGPPDPCPICLCEMDDPKALGRCQHSFCCSCIDKAFRTRPACPVCGQIYGVFIGDQPPNGSMTVTKDKTLHLPGYESYGTILITYCIPGGTQGVDHPNPGQPYQGTTRYAYLPDSKEGQKVQRLLATAFDQRLIFTVGTSRTTGKHNVVTWNDIHHKTNPWGGAQHFGYPDPLYLSRVEQELAAKGVTAD